MTAACIGEPVSWLRLERYALGALGGDAAREIEAHVARCPACRACLARIEDDARALPPLPELAARAAAARAPARRPWWSWPRLAWAGGLVAAAAALLLVVLLPREDGAPGSPETRDAPGPRVAIKAGGADAELIVSVVRERGGVITERADAAAPGDRLKVRVTCAGAPGAAVHADVVVFQGGASFPLAPARIACGNDVVLPGAFRLTDDAPATVCLAVDPGAPPDRAQLRRDGPRGPALGCVTLR